jgi:trk system potassium uptake protein TrkA
MYIIIIGGGRVGFYLSKALLSEGHEILVIEKIPGACEAINDELGAVCLRGDGCEASTLAEAGVGRADMLVATTADDEDNLVACQLAKHKFKVPRTIALIRNPKNGELFKKLGVDVTISTTNIILEHITEEVPTHSMTHLMEIRDRGLEIVEVRISADAASVGKAVKDLSLPSGSMLFLIVRKAQKPIVPTPTTILMVGDQVIAVTAPESEQALRTALRGE